MKNVMTDLADTLHGFITLPDVHVAERLACNICSENLVLPLLCSLQSEEDDQEKIDEKESARLYLNFLVSCSHNRLTRSGWNVLRRGGSVGSYIFRHSATGQESESPVLEGQTWQHDLLQNISLLIVHGESAIGGKLWAVRVHEVSQCIRGVFLRLNDLVCSAGSIDAANSSLISVTQHTPHDRTSQWSIIDVLKFSEDDDVTATSSEKRYHRQRLEKETVRNHQEHALEDSLVMRQVVLGTWRGPNMIPFSEATASGGVELETWHETTMAAMAVLTIKRRDILALYKSESGGDSRKETNILVLGAARLSGVINFIQAYQGGASVNIIMIEEDRALAEQALKLLRHPCKEIKCCENSADLSAIRRKVEGSKLCMYIASYKDFFAGWHSSESATLPVTPVEEFPTLGVKVISFFDVVLVGSGCQLSEWYERQLMAVLIPGGVVVTAGIEGCNTSIPQDMHVDEEICANSEGGVYLRYKLEELNQTRGESRSDCGESCVRSNEQNVWMPGKVLLTLLIHDPPRTSASNFTSPPATNALSPDQFLPVSVDMWDQFFVKTADGCSGGDISDQKGTISGMLPLSMDVKRAQQTEAVLLPNIVTPQEASQLHALAGRIPSGGRVWSGGGTPVVEAKLGCEIRSHHSKLWEVLFLQSYGAIHSTMPEFLQKITEEVISLDGSYEWGFNLKEGNFNLRVCEYHCQVAPSEALADIYHYDQDSLVTVDIMLSDPSNDFSGAEIQTLEQDGSLLTHNVEQYDALCFLSHKYHSVTPLRKGRRVVCVLEFWRGSPFAR